jgi:tetratricopeptide (TPR) repeat protein
MAADEYDRAKSMFQQQLDIGDESTDTAADIDAAIMLGDLLRREGDIITAQSYYRRAGRSAPRMDYHHGVAEALIRQIELFNDSGDQDTVIQLQRQALEAARKTSDVGLQSRLILSLAESLARAGRVDDVIEQLEDGVEIAREIGDLSVEGECLTALVEAYRQQGDIVGVARRQSELLQLEERLGNRPDAAKWAVRLGTSLMALDKPQRAVEAYARAHQHARSLNDPRLEQRALGGLGVAYTALDRPADALENLMRALEIARQTADLPRQAQWLASIGQALWTFDQPEDAVGALNESLTIARRIDDVSLQCELLSVLGEILDATGQLPRSRECYHRALDLARRLGEKDRQIQLMTALGGIASRAQQHSQANALFTQAMQLAIEIGDRPAGARLQGRLGKLSQRQRDWPKALEHYRRAVDIAESIDNPRLTSQLLLHLAGAQHSVGDPAAASSYRRALALSQQVGDVHREALIRLNLGILLSTDGQRSEGLDHLYQAADLVADMGPLGADLARQIEEAIVRAGGNVVAQPRAFHLPSERSFQFGVPPGEEDIPRSPHRQDEFFGEATLPPR